VGDMPASLSRPSATAPAIADRATRDEGAHRSLKLRMAWVPARDLGHPGWVEAGQQLGAIGRVSNWWVGDWLQYGTSRWGEKYVEAARITGYDVKTLRNIAYVAKRFDLSRRRDKLHWSHHAEVAVLEAEEQDRWLDRAIVDRLSVADLRVELRGSLRSSLITASRRADPAKPDSDACSMVCPHCGKHISLRGGVQP
jgi:hypothetical protein